MIAYKDDRVFLGDRDRRGRKDRVPVGWSEAAAPTFSTQVSGEGAAAGKGRQQGWALPAVSGLTLPSSVSVALSKSKAASPCSSPRDVS